MFDELKAVVEGLVTETKATLTAVQEQVAKVSKRQDELEAKGNRPKIVPSLPGAEGLTDEQREYKAELTALFRTGKPEASEGKAMRVGISPDGGYLVEPTQSRSFIERLFATSPIRSIARVETMESGDAFEQPNDLEEFASNWVGEEGASTDTDTGKIGKLYIPVHEMDANPKVTQRLIDTSSFDIEGRVMTSLGKSFGRKEATAFVSGNGVSKPRGFMSYAAASVTTADADRAWGVLQHVVTGAAAGFPVDSAGRSNPDCLVDLVASLNAAYRSGARWLMNKASVAVVSKLKDADGRYLWQQSLTAGAPSMLLGYPVTEAEDMPNFGAGLFPIAFGDFREGYCIVDLAKSVMLRDPYTAKPFIKFYTRRYVGGDVANFDAIKLLKCST